ncbi:hypothetical protein [Intestinibacter sp.]
MIFKDMNFDFKVLDNLEEIINKWIQIFCKDINREEIKRYDYLREYMDLEKVDFLEGDEAENKYR